MHKASINIVGSFNLSAVKTAVQHGYSQKKMRVYLLVPKDRRVLPAVMELLHSYLDIEQDESLSL